MRKDELVAVIANETRYSIKEVACIMESFMKEVIRAVSDGKTVHLRGFGSFFPANFKAKSVRDFGSNTNHTKPACIRPKFKPSKQFISKLDGRRNQNNPE